MKKCGLQYEGTLKESGINNQGICDASWYALIRKDYFIEKRKDKTDDKYFTGYTSFR